MDIFSLVGKITVNYGDAVKGIDEVSSKAGNLASSLGKTMQSAGDKMSSVGKAMAPVSIAVGGVATAAIKTSMDFDSAMSQVSAVSGATGEDFEALRNKAIEMGGKTKFSASEAADAMNYMAMAGWKTEDMLSGIDGIMNLAAASGEDLATTSDIVTDALTAFGLSASDSGHFADILAAASSNANTNVSMMGETFKYIAPVAGALGYSAEDTAIAIGLMANAGIKSSQSGTSLRSALSKLVAPTDSMAESMLKFGLATQETGVDQEKLEKAQRKVENATLDVQKAQVTYNEAVTKYGETSPQAQKALIGVEKASLKLEQAQSDLDKVQNTLVGTGEFHNLVLNDENGNARSLREVLIFLRETLGGLDEQEQAAALSAVFGTEAMSGMAAIVNASNDDFEKLVGAIDDCGGTTEKMAETMQDNLAGQLTILKSQLETLALSIVDLFTPAIRGIVTHVQNFVDWLIGLDDSTKTVIGTVIVAVAALSPVLITGGKIISGIGTIVGGIGKLAGGIGKIISVGGKLIGGIGKIVSIIPQIIGVVSGVVTFVTGTVIPIIGTIVSGIGTVITTIGAVVTSIGLVPIAIAALVAGVVAAGVAIWQNWDTIKEKASELWGHVKEKFNAIKDSISESFTKAKEAVTKKVEEIKKNVAEGWEHMKTSITTKMGEWKTNADKKLSEIKTSFTTKVSEIKKDWSEKFTNIKDTATEKMQAAKQNVSTKLSEVKKNFSTKVSEIKTDWSTKFTNIRDTATNLTKTAGQNVATKLSEMKTNFDSRTSEIKSDWSSKFTNVKDTATNLTGTAMQNVSAKLDNMRAAFNEKGGGIKGIAAATFTGIKDNIGSLMGAANTLTGGKLEEIKSAFTSKLGNAKDTVVSVMENVKSGFESKMEGARTAVHNAIEKIKGLFNFNWSLPKIKLPHFNISGKFSLDPPSMPKIGVEWYAKAMNDGMIMNQPTVFGYNPKSNQLLAGGEAGSETVVGTESLMNMIKSAVASESSDLVPILKQILDAVVSLDKGLEEKFCNALLCMKFQINEREFARLVRAV